MFLDIILVKYTILYLNAYILCAFYLRYMAVVTNAFCSFVLIGSKKTSEKSGAFFVCGGVVTNIMTNIFAL